MVQHTPVVRGPTAKPLSFPKRLPAMMIGWLPVLVLSCDSDTQPVPGEAKENMIIENNVRIPVRDKVTLSGNVYRPAGAERVPVIISLTPYDKDELPAEYDPDQGDIKVSNLAAFEMPDPAYWVPHGYAVIAVSARGTGSSEGDISLFSQQEAEDYYDVIEWAAQASWSNGRVGLNGVSYMAVSQWQVAALAPPHLNAIIPWEGFVDLYRDAVYHGGIQDTFMLGWTAFVESNRNPSSTAFTLADDIKDAPLDSELYEALRPKLSQIEVPAYIATSWPDHGLHTRGTLLGFEGISSKHRWLEVHGRRKWEWYYSKEALERQRKFLDYFLKNEANDMLDVARVTYEARTAYYEGETRTAKAWPIPEAEHRSLYLDANSMTLTSELETESSTTTYAAAKPAQDDALDDHRAVFSYVFDEPAELTGSMNLRLWVSVEDADDITLFVGIQKWSPDGKHVPFYSADADENGQAASGWLRVSHRQLNQEKSRPNRPYHDHQSRQLLSPEEIVEAQVEIWPSSTVFDKGDKLLVVIQGFDLEESGLNHIGLADGTVMIHTGEDTPSQLVVPYISLSKE